MRRSGAEKTITEPLVRRWAIRIGMDLSVIDSSAVYSHKARMYLRTQTSESLTDLCGNYGYLSVWIELKAPKKMRSILQSPHQILFLERKIKAGCFACVTDSVEHIDNLWKMFINEPDIEKRKLILLAAIPRPKAVA